MNEYYCEIYRHSLGVGEDSWTIELFATAVYHCISINLPYIRKQYPEDDKYTRYFVMNVRKL